MDVEDVRIVDGLIFGYLSRRQYHETLRALCNEAPYLRDARSRFQSGGDVFIQVNDQLHDKNLEEIVSAFSSVGRFDVTPELIDFGIRLRDLTNEFSTMTAVRGRSISDNQVKLYGKRSFRKSVQTRQAVSTESVRPVNSQSANYRQIAHCESQNAKEPDYSQQFHNACVSDSNEVIGGPHFVNQRELNYEYLSQPHASCTASVMSPYRTDQARFQNPSVNTAHEVSSRNTPPYETGQLITRGQSTVSDEEQKLIDYSINTKSSAASVAGFELDVATARCSAAEVGESEDAAQSQPSPSFSYESGAHKRKAAVPHRRDELVAHTAQSLIVSNGVLVDLDANGMVNNTSRISLLSNIDDSAMQCLDRLDRLINGNVDEVFPFCDDNDGLSNFGGNMCNQFSPAQSNENALAQEGTQEMFNKPPSPLDINPCANLPLAEAHSSSSRSRDEGEIISDESLHLENSQKPVPFASTDTRSNEFEVPTGREHSAKEQPRRSSFDSGRDKACERKVADRLREFNRNPPKKDTRVRKSTVDRTDLPDAVIHEARNVPRVSPPLVSRGRFSRADERCFAALFDEGCSAPSSRESSPPHRERVNRREEERRRREKEMEKARQRDKDRIKQRRDRETRRDKERFHRVSPDRKLTESKAYRKDDEEKGESREKERKREHGGERRVSDDAEKKKADEKGEKELLKKKKERQLEAKRQYEHQRRAEAMKRKEEDDKKRQEKERFDDMKKDDEKRRMEEEKLQKKKEEGERKDVELWKLGEESIRQVTNYTDDGHETVKSSEEVDGQSVNSAGDSFSSDVQHIGRNHSDDEVVNRHDLQTQENRGRFNKVEVTSLRKSSSGDKVAEPLSRSLPGSLQKDRDCVSVENEEHTQKPKEEVRTSRCVIDSKKSIHASATVRRRDEVKKIIVKPLEPGMMMSDTGVLDRINKEMESLAPRNRCDSVHSPEESPCSTKSTFSLRTTKKETPVDYNQVLFSNPPVVKRTVPIPEKKKVFIISSGLSTGNHNHLVFSKAHSSRLGMFLEKVSDKHKRFMERESDRAFASPAYEDSDRNGVRSPVSVSQFPKQQQQRFAPQKRPLPASSLESYLGSPPQNLPDSRDQETTTSRPLGKKSKIDLSKMPDIIEKLYSGKNS